MRRVQLAIIAALLVIIGYMIEPVRMAVAHLFPHLFQSGLNDGWGPLLGALTGRRAIA